MLDPSASAEARERYTKHYAVARIRRLAISKAGSRHDDLYRALKFVMIKLSSNGCPELALPALGSFLFSPNSMPHLDKCEISNRDLLAVVRSLAVTQTKQGRRGLDYKNLGAEELGSVYESLLELHPAVDTNAALFELRVAAGSERKTSGSYYTPTSLISCLLDSALDPVLHEAAKQPNPEEAILKLKVVDPACGSGHFLIAAAHRIAKRLAAVRTGEEEPPPGAQRKALRDVIGHCIYGVDVNPMAVELCKVSLWMEALEPGKPLSFLEHRIQCGNSLLGATPALLVKGIPDDAFTPIEGDDKEICKEFKKVNKDERNKQLRMFAATTEPWQQLGNFAASLMNLDTVGDDSIEAIRDKERMYEDAIRSGDYLDGCFWADTWCAAFVWKKTREFNYPITEEIFRRIERNPHGCEPWMRREIERLAGQYRFFHRHLAFPDVFHIPPAGATPENQQTGWNGGFALVLGNPKWERIKLQEKEWFAARRPDIAGAQNTAARARMIRDLQDEDPTLYAVFRESLRHADAEGQIVRNGGRYPLCAVGDINTYALFAETMKMIVAPTGRVGALLPCGIATDDTTKRFFQAVTSSRSLVSVTGFINEEMLFPAVLHNFKFCLLVLTGTLDQVNAPDFVFNCHNLSHASDASRHFRLTFDEILLLNPNTGTAPVFFWNRSAEITKDIYKRLSVLDRGWQVSFLRMFDMSNDSHLFMTTRGEETLPLYEGKMLHQFNHRFASYESMGEGERSHMLPETPAQRLADPAYAVTPCYYVSRSDVESRLRNTTARNWLLVFREITSAGLARTMIASIMPRVGANHKTPLIVLGPDRDCLVPAFLACLNSFVLDFCARQKLGGSSFSYFIMRQLPVPDQSMFGSQCPWDDSVTISDWIKPRVLELSFTSRDLVGFGADFGALVPFKWNEDRRFQLRSELDAAFFRVYRLDRESAEYVMDTFPLISARDQDRFGEYRTKRVILEIYEAMAEAERTGGPYQTRLDPPPADPRVAHPVTEA